MVDAHQWLSECGFVLMAAYPYPYAYAPNVISRYIPVSFILDIDDFFFAYVRHASYLSNIYINDSTSHATSSRRDVIQNNI